MKSKTGTLYVVALPIGNPKDITLRAIEVLNAVDVIAAEDTRTFQELANQIKVTPRKLVAHHEHNEEQSVKGLLQILENGNDVALVSDAGTPVINDPGFRFLREAYAHAIQVRPIPGPSALMAALSAAPIGGGNFYFGGFPPAQSKSRKETLQAARSQAQKLIFFEAPHRIVEHLQDALEIFGNTEVCVCRELTKLYEEILFTPLEKALDHFKQNEPKGEFVLIYQSPPDDMLSLETLEETIREKLNNGERPSDIVKEFQGLMKKKELYNLVLKLEKKNNQK
jgi:16S rRNA (cytidine1402-2'-O)-methyltransferase